MMRAICERKLVSFLTSEGFQPEVGRAHRSFRKGPHLVQWHTGGLDGRHTMLLLWSIERAGYERKPLKKALGLL